MTRFEAAVIGAGPTGLAVALALAQMSIEVAIVAPAGGSVPGSDPQGPTDGRTTALMSPSINLLKNLGVWGSDPEGLTPHAAPLAAVRIADDRSGLIRAPEVLCRAAELGLQSFGANIANPVLVGALRRAAERDSRLAWVETVAVKSIAPQASSARLELAEGGAVEAELVVAADGRNSIGPGAAGITVDTWTYPQVAIVTSFGHSRPHAETVNELHRHAGPLTTVPLPGRRSALVWVEAPQEARRLAALDDAAFAGELEERLQGVLGTIADMAPRGVHPLSGRRARRMASARIALVGEAAHVLAPIGAQGLNLGLRDAAALADCAGRARSEGEDIAGPAALADYHRSRAADVLGRSTAVDLLNRSLLADMLSVDMLRGLAAHLVVSFPFVRRILMEEGMGLAGPLPSLMR